MVENTLFFSKTPFGELKFDIYKLHPDMPRWLGYRLFIDDGLQFDSRDEYRYHQLLFLLPYYFTKKEKVDVLILGGGDGLGVKQLLKIRANIKSITLVDISQDMINFARDYHIMKELNENSLHDEKVKIIIDDGKEFVKREIEKNKKYDLIILDYPDPMPFKESPINDLFTKEHYSEVSKILSKDGIMALQATSVLTMPNTFRKIQLELEKCFKSILPSRINIISFGDIGITYCKNDSTEWKIEKKIPEFFFLDESNIDTLFKFYKDEMPNFEDNILEDLHISEIIDFDLLKTKFF